MIKHKNKIIFAVLILLLIFALYFIFKQKAGEFTEFKDDNTYLINYEINQLIPVNINEEQVAKFYLAEYTKLIIFDPQRAYDLIHEDYREIKFPNLNSFKETFKNEIDSTFLSSQIDKLSIKQSANYKEIYIVDTSGNTYIFLEESLMNYKVIFDIYTI